MARLSAEDWDGNQDAFRHAMASMPPEEFAEYLDGLPEPALDSLLRDTASFDASMPSTPLAQAMELDRAYKSRPHLKYLSDRIAVAVEDVKNGKSRQLAVSMPPRSGKSELVSKYLPVWLLRQNPTWKLGLMSYSPTLAASWSREVRRFIEQHGPTLGLEIATDAGAVGDWETTQKGEVHARSMGQGLTGFGANILVIDDPVKDYATAHNENSRDALWNKWTADIRTRREPPSLTIVVQTRWHQTDFIGRLLSDKYVGDPNDWEVISFPALAEENDVLGRSKGDPLLSPLIPEDAALALEWWMGLKSGMSSYEWAALFQQRPAPATGAIFSTDWWGYWTTDPAKVSYSETSGEPDGKVILRPPDLMTAGRVLDSWDLNFDDTANSDFVVGQRWAKSGQRRFLVDQRRGRWDFPTTLREFEEWNGDGLVHEHLVEKKANGAAMIASMRNKFSGIKPVSPTQSKEVRARAVTAEIESGHVYLPHPDEYPWVTLLQDELRNFPSGTNDDMVDTLTQALSELRGGDDVGGITVPGRLQAERRGLGEAPGSRLGMTRVSRALPSVGR